MKTVFSACGIFIALSNVSDIFKIITRLLQLSTTSFVMENAIQLGLRLCIQILVQDILLDYKTQIHNLRNKITNGRMFVKSALKLLKRNMKTVDTSDIISSRILYLFGNYRLSLRLALRVKHQLQRSDIMYPWTRGFDLYVRYNGRNMSHVEFIKRYVAYCVSLTSNSCLEELKLEVSAAEANIRPLLIPPLILANFLLVLNYHALKDTIRRDDVVREIETLTQYDDGRHMHVMHHAILVEILGICHQICNNYPRAYQCYLMALNEEYNVFKQATLLRIQSMVDMQNTITANPCM